MITPDRLASWRHTADLDARAGAPVGKALREACDEIEELGQQISAAHHDLRIAVGDAYTTVNSAAFEATRQIAELTADRDRARDAAVALEQENARQAEELGQARLDEQYEAMATAGAFDDEEPF